MIITEQLIRETLMISEQTRDSYLLYGSFARGDYESSSDIDVLRITTSRMRAPRTDGRALMHIYDINDLLEMAKRGDLFILHLVQEAKPIHDPCKYLTSLSAAFQKPESYLSDALRRVGPASALLHVNEALFKTRPNRFMDAAIFLCRTLLYAKHADRGSFSFSLRALAKFDETAALICRVRNQSVSYADFQRIRQVIRNEIGYTTACEEAFSISELSQKGQSNPLFESLLRRIIGASDSDPYFVVARNEASVQTT